MDPRHLQPPYDQEWLNYQYEIGRRHTREKKNRMDDADAVDHIHAPYLITFIYPITATIRDFLENGDHSDAEVEEMFHACFKSVTLQVTLWTQPYFSEATGAGLGSPKNGKVFVPLGEPKSHGR